MLGDRDTVFGDLDTPFETLPEEYRAHGSLHEMDVPLVIYNAQARLSGEEFLYNWHVARFSYFSDVTARSHHGAAGPNATNAAVLAVSAEPEIGAPPSDG